MPRDEPKNIKGAAINVMQSSLTSIEPAARSSPRAAAPKARAIRRKSVLYCQSGLFQSSTFAWGTEKMRLFDRKETWLPVPENLHQVEMKVR